MKVLVDESKFDALQMDVGYALIHEVHTALKKAGVPDGEQLEQIAAEALFGIGCVLDGSREVAGPDEPMQVMLTFKREEDDDTLISAGATSWIHESAHGIAEDYFDRLRPRAKRRAPRPTKREAPRLNLLDVIPTGWFVKRRKP